MVQPPPLPKGGAMATERLSMRQIREILRQKWDLGRSHREVAESLGLGLGHHLRRPAARHRRPGWIGPRPKP